MSDRALQALVEKWRKQADAQDEKRRHWLEVRRCGPVAATHHARRDVYRTCADELSQAFAAQRQERPADLQRILDAVNRYCDETPDGRFTADEIAEIVVLIGEVQHLRREALPASPARPGGWLESFRQFLIHERDRVRNPERYEALDDVLTTFESMWERALTAASPARARLMPNDEIPSHIWVLIEKMAAAANELSDEWCGEQKAVINESAARALALLVQITVEERP